jgi:hypothetical protein
MAAPVHRLSDLRRALRKVAGPRARGAGERGERAPEWLRQPGVQGIGISRRVTDGRRLRDLAITIFVEEKLPIRDVAVPVPRTLESSGLESPVITDVVAIGKARLEAFEPNALSPGCAISRIEVASGTLGCIVTRNDDPRPHLLTAAHVIAPLGAQIDDPVLHPGFEDGGRPPLATLARLAAWAELTVTDDDYPNYADAAIARLVDPASVDPTIPSIGRPAGRTDSLRIGTQVQTFGRVSAYQRAKVIALDFNVELTMSLPNGQSGRVGFSDLVLCTHYSAQGDSGAAVLNMNRQLVGLHMGATDTTSFFCRAGNVCAALGIEIPD